MPAFRTDWDTDPNPAYDVWTTTNGGEILPGILTPFAATLYNHLDCTSLPRLMKAYPTGKRVKTFREPVGNFFGITAGRLTLNVGFSVAAMSCLDPDIAAAMAGQFFRGSDDAQRLIVSAPPGEVAAANEIATAQREAAEASARASQTELYAERATDRYALDRALAPKAAWKRLHELVDPTLDLLNQHYIVSTAAGEMQVRLAGLLDAAGVDPNAVVGLCSGLGEVESSKPAIALYELATIARRHPEVAVVLRDGAAADVLTACDAATTRGWSTFGAALSQFLFEFGFRGQGEADPTNADWSEQPTFAISQIRSMMGLAADESPRAQVKRAMAGRRQLERTVRASLPKPFRVPFDAAVAQAQRFTRMRELTKAVWVLGTRRMRAPLLAVADGLVAQGRLHTADDMLFCTYTEVGALVRGRDVPDLGAAIARRRRQWRRAHDYVLPDAFVGTTTPKRKPAVVDVRTLQGLGVSVGVATGTARVILDTEAAFARDLDPGEILVAPFTDTPWTPLFIPAGAVVVETGGVLSHAATVAREFGIPCVVLVPDATRAIRDGDTVRVDGAAGTIEIIARAG
jgi:pyruvate,water dikinase